MAYHGLAIDVRDGQRKREEITIATEQMNQYQVKEID